MNHIKKVSKWQHFQEALLIYLLKDIPTRFIGGRLRNLLYRNIFAAIGSSSYIDSGVRFFATSRIELGNVEILSNTQIDAKESLNNKICLKDGVSIKQGVYIRARHDKVIEIGERTLIEASAYIIGGDVKIGKDCLIASHS